MIHIKSKTDNLVIICSNMCHNKNMSSTFLYKLGKHLYLSIVKSKLIIIKKCREVSRKNLQSKMRKIKGTSAVNPLEL